VNVLDFVIPLNERHLNRILQRWVAHYNRGRPHAILGLGIPERPLLDDATTTPEAIRSPDGNPVVATAILGDLHHEYRLEDGGVNNAFNNTCGEKRRAVPAEPSIPPSTMRRWVRVSRNHARRGRPSGRAVLEPRILHHLRNWRRWRRRDRAWVELDAEEPVRPDAV